jgi:SAM-dependent methyltransferase
LIVSHPSPWVRVAVTATDFPAPHALGHRFVRDRVLREIASSAIHRLRGTHALPPADPVKRWDVLNVLGLSQFLSNRSAAILDCGAYNSESLWELAQRGFTNLYGIDLNPHIVAAPRSRRICYSVQDMQHTAFADSTFDYVISVSTVEHGVSWPAFLREAHRLLKPGGLLYVSTDVVHEETDTTGLTAFGLSWNPLRPADVPGISTLLSNMGFECAPPISLQLPKELPLEFLGRKVGFIGFCGIRRAD